MDSLLKGKSLDVGLCFDLWLEDVSSLIDDFPPDDSLEPFSLSTPPQEGDVS